jgi:hypothetical protein
MTMARIYRFPFRSRVARLIADYLLPDRVHAWIWLNALAEVDDLMEEVHHVDDDGSETYFSAVSAIRVENLRRKVCRRHLGATTVGQ